MNLLNIKNRPHLLNKLKTEHFDVVVVGGGITGSGIALDCASRGLKVALVEKKDFAAGTSSRSTKLIHGGLRYLKQFEIGLVREVGRERAVVHRLAPHLVLAEKMLLPLVEGGTYGKMATSVGLMVYDVLAGVERADQRVMLSKEETLELEPLLNAEHLQGGGLYAEYRTDDSRLTIEVIKTASRHGASCTNYCKVTDFMYNDREIIGVRCEDRLNNETFDIKADVVVNAAGPWVDHLRKKDGSQVGKRLHLTKGVHLVVNRSSLPVQQALYFDVPDGRMIFAIPRGRCTYIGTTDTEYKGEPDQVRTNREDVDYLLSAVNATFPEVNLCIDDVISSWAGLRPLIHEEGKSASEISRKDELFVSDSGLISIAGGKLTGYRKMAERVTDKVIEQVEAHRTVSEEIFDELRKSSTEKIVLTGGVFTTPEAVETYKAEVANYIVKLGLPQHYAGYLVHNFGRQTDFVLDRLIERKEADLEERLLLSELDFCLQHEIVATALDFFDRRTGRIYFGIKELKKYKERVLMYMQEQLSWSEQRLQQEHEWLEHEIEVVSEFPAANAQATA